MSKITFRADDDLVERLEALDTSKSEAMREALRTYLDGTDRDPDPDVGTDDRPGADPVDDVIRARVDELVADRIDELAERPRRGGRDLSVSVTVDGVAPSDSVEWGPTAGERSGRDERKTRSETSDPDADTEAPEQTCDKCGERVDDDHVYCPNCGEKSSHRVFCECGDELRSDWAFCPGCGRRTSAADVLEQP
ncbi:ribbon-helix-helix protein, CopG family [Halobellus sp. Atlit-31R]|nr:ribbon-helix-helix protein, CopG family [Halobellus sp. Atlit-31R]